LRATATREGRQSRAAASGLGFEIGAGTPGGATIQSDSEYWFGGQLRSDLLADLRLRCSRYESISSDIMNGLPSELDQLPSDAPDISANIAAAVARAASRGGIGPHPVPAHVLAAPHALLRAEATCAAKLPSPDTATAIAFSGSSKR
jgi:hypothetical protein